MTIICTFAAIFHDFPSFWSRFVEHLKKLEKRDDGPKPELGKKPPQLVKNR